ncbi:integrin alpha-9-like [Liolophura sinensis]|uniref:integrin alpha-9-like n=1 Tax=Liolophura sinensis TaxID=3198878 RepID=UPI003158EC8C
MLCNDIVVGLTLALTSILHIAECFNIDINLSRLQQGPAGSDFGFALGILRNDSQGVRLIIGAPKSNSTFQPGTLQTGSVFDCSYDQIKCTELDMGVSDDNKPVQIENQRLGFSIAVGEEISPRITACAPLWKNTRIQAAYLAQGRCHEIGYGNPPRFSATYTPMKPRRSSVKDKLVHGDKYIKGMGQGGFSIHYSKTVNGKSELVAGAPGYYDWKGGIAYIDNTTTDVYSLSMLGEQFPSNSYTAYSMTSGHFFSTRHLQLVTGSPNWNNTGKVIVMKRTFKDTLLEHQGEQFGSYFGAAVCAVDVNNDSFDELLIGAPLYSSTYEEGKVYVYKSNKLDYMVARDPLVGPGVAGGRFGTTIGSVGDLNNDDFNDVIIGAPFAYTTGAIYIYQGSSTGLRTTPSQTIQGKSIEPNLRGFGWSISKSFDTDENGYPDLAVGAPMSDHVVTLRTVPVASVSASLDIGHNVISLQPSCRFRQRIYVCTDVTLTFAYTGKQCPPTLDIEFELRADTLTNPDEESGRAQFIMTSDIISPSIHRNLTLLRGKVVRFNYQVIIQPRKDKYTDVGFELRIKQKNNCQLGAEKCPIPDIYSPDLLRKQVPFAKECGDDDVCIADLSLDSYAPSSLLIGSSKYPVKVVVKNRGEAAYLTTVNLNYDKQLAVTDVTTVESPPGATVTCELGPSPRDDKGQEQVTMICYTGNPLPPDGFVHFLLTFDVSELRARSNTTTISLKASTLSEELNATKADNVMSIDTVLMMEAHLTVQGASLPEQIRYGQPQAHTDTDVESKRIPVVHEYTVANVGRGSTPGIDVQVSVPSVDNQGRQLVHISSVEVLPIEGQRQDIDGHCHWDPLKPPTGSEEGGQSSSDDVEYLTCLTTKCVTVTCQVSELKRGDAAVVFVNGWVEESTFWNYGSNSAFKLKTNATVTVQQHSLLVLGSFQKGHSHIVTDIFGPLTSPADPWILLGCLLGGFLLLCLICLVLWKVGFFKRKKRDDLKQLLREENSNVELDSVSSQGQSPTGLGEVPPPAPPGAVGGADYIVPVSKNTCPDDPYLHPVSVALPPSGRTSNNYVRLSSEDKAEDMDAFIGTRM